MLPPHPPPNCAPRGLARRRACHVLCPGVQACAVVPRARRWHSRVSGGAPACPLCPSYRRRPTWSPCGTLLFSSALAKPRRRGPWAGIRRTDPAAAAVCAARTGGRLQLVLMRHPPPAICQNLWGVGWGGGSWGGGPAGGRGGVLPGVGGGGVFLPGVVAQRMTWSQMAGADMSRSTCASTQLTSAVCVTIRSASGCLCGSSGMGRCPLATRTRFSTGLKGCGQGKMRSEHFGAGGGGIWHDTRVYCSRLQLAAPTGRSPVGGASIGQVSSSRACLTTFIANSVP